MHASRDKERESLAFDEIYLCPTLPLVVSIYRMALLKIDRVDLLDSSRTC